METMLKAPRNGFGIGLLYMVALCIIDKTLCQASHSSIGTLTKSTPKDLFSLLGTSHATSLAVRAIVGDVVLL